MQTLTTEVAQQIAPGPRFASHATFLWRVRRDPLRFYLDAWKRYGNFVRFERGGGAVYLLIHPDSVKHVLQDNASNYSKDGIFEDRIRPMAGGALMTTQGADWIRRRRIMSPLLKGQNLGPHRDTTVAAVEKAFERWDLHAERGETMDFVTALRDLNLDTSGRLLMAVETAADEPVGQAIRITTDAVVGRLDRVVPLPTWTPTLANLRFTRARRLLLDVIEGEITKCESNPTRRDFLAGLLRLRDDNGDRAYERGSARDEILSMILAWHKGPATALCWALYFLARHPEVQRALQDEVDRTLAGRTASFDDLANLPTCQMVVKETLRLFPALWGITRQAARDDEIAGFPVAAGSKVILSPYITHRSPEIWDTPEQFRPERFAAEARSSPTRWDYFPFGRGLRQCPGEHFANMQMHLTLSMVAQRYTVTRDDPNPVVTTFLPTPRPAGPLPMRLTRR